MTSTCAHPMTRLDTARTVTRPNRVTGLRQIEEAVSADGQWTYRREEDAGSTWSVRHETTGRVLRFEPSLRAARRGTASGWTLAELDHLDERHVEDESPGQVRPDPVLVPNPVGLRLHLVTPDEAYVLAALDGRQGEVSRLAAQAVVQLGISTDRLADQAWLARTLRALLAKSATVTAS